jgi:hypothetical protein
MSNSFVLEQLPIDVVGDAGSSQNLSSILTAALGPDAGGYSGYWIAYYGASYLQENDFSYWNLSDPVVTGLSENGTDIGASTESDFNQIYVAPAQLSSITLDLGNVIAPFVFIVVPVSTGGGTTDYIQYEINVVAPGLQSPTAGDGEPTPSDIVASAKRFAAVYSGVLNDNDCGLIADDVAAAAGATLDNEVSGSTDPAQNESAGFWRVVYRGSDPNPVADWQTLVRPGDIVRMAWTAGSYHTTTVLSVNSNGSITVFDNNGENSAGEHEIGIHTVNYDTQTIATSITIFRLTTDDLYLINGITGEIMNGTPMYNNEFDAVSGDIVNCGPKNDVVNVGTGNITINGGQGFDTAVFSGDRSSYTITRSLLTTTVSGANGTDTLTSVDLLKFADGTMALPAAPSDFTDAGISDILFRNDGAGDIGFYQMNNGVSTGWVDVGASSIAYSVVGIGNFMGTGTGDVLYRNSGNGDTGFYEIVNGLNAGWHDIGASSTAYSVVGVGDFTGNGTDDVLYRNNTNGDTGFYEIVNGVNTGWHDIGASATTYSVVGVGDVTGSGTDDILYRNNTTGDTGFYKIVNGANTGWHDVGASSTAYSVVGVGDFMGNGTDDILYRNNGTGDTGFYAIVNGVNTGWHDIGASSTAYSVVATGDYLGTGTDDILFRNNTTGDTGFYAIVNGADAGWHDIGASSTAYHVVT